MKEYFAPRLVKATSDFVAGNFGLLTELTADRRPELSETFSSFAEETDALGLPMTHKAAKALAEAVKTETRESLEERIKDVQSRFDDESDTLTLFYVNQDAFRYYNKTNLFGEQFKSNFPTANVEVIEAGNCFAFDRFTACVYHLMRATEIVVRTTFVSLGMPPHIWGATKWSKLLDRIKGKIDKNNKTRADDPQWKQDRSFYEGVHAFLAAVRVPVRNATMHVESIYDEAGAQNVFDSVKAFMRHVATKLKE